MKETVIKSSSFYLKLRRVRIWWDSAVLDRLYPLERAPDVIRDRQKRNVVHTDSQCYP